MASFTLAEVAAAVGGERLMGEEDLVLSSFAIDSRLVRGSELFFALRGPRHDGHDFLAGAFARGAAAAVVSRADAASRGACASIPSRLLARAGFAPCSSIS